MNCIFICVFNNEKYITMFYLLFKSLMLYGNLTYNTEILVYTSTDFMNKIKQNPLFNDKIKFELNDTYNNIDKACKSRLDLFDLPSIESYAQILYLDTDIVVKGDINQVFEVVQEDILYVLQEGNLTKDGLNNYFGRCLFSTEEIKNLKDTTAFTSGILLFNNCKVIQELFENINKDIRKRPKEFLTFDQPYIVYNAFKYNLYNNKILKSLAVNNDANIHSDKIIHHFPGCPGIAQNKLIKMTTFLETMSKSKSETIK